MTSVAPLLEMSGISKSFPGVKALQNVNLRVEAGQVVALMGENGAGKSTLIRMLGGAHQPDAGSIRMNDQPIILNDPSDAIRAGIGVIYQEFNLIPALTAWENIFLGRESSRFFVQRNAERKRAGELFELMGVTIPLDVPCRTLSIAQQQLVEIAKALSQDVRILVMDEPSAALTPKEVRHLFQIIEELKGRGIGIVYISHRLDEVFEIADVVTVLRDGQHVADEQCRSLSRQRLIELMVGRSIEQEFPELPHEIGEERFCARHLNRGTAVRDVSLSVRRGEILGITGLVGSGRTETLRLIFGADPMDSGEMELDGRQLRISSPRIAIQNGIVLLTEDRKSQGLVLGRSVRENFSLANMRQFSSMGVVHQGRERDAFASFVESLNIRIPGQEQLAKNLSGGNQQKVVLARWLQRNAELIMFDEPTRGIDVGARYEIYLLIQKLAQQGKAVIVVSSELPEIIGVSDRILVMHEGQITGEVTDMNNVTQPDLLKLAVGDVTAESMS
ncbi:MAG: sugar ABC transporter ATP-binding protein [Planctomycetaceae bacterium]|nr:sugar ABC transporter ATP-binding protein [Planctomycetaceae bacterium]